MYLCAKLDNQDFMEPDDKGIATGGTKDDKKQRKQFIIDFYGKWIAENPAKQIFNHSLNDFINVRFLSFQETAGHASHTCKSTIAVTYLSDILKNAKYLQTVKPKSENKNQQRFSEIIVMKYSKEGFGEIKLTVGVLKGSKQKIQYCVTAVE
jgi:phenolic acid decarboxylase